jgi:katanin p80 WD40 repeat-containing subunit B1
MKSIVIFISLIYFPCTGSADRTVKFWDLETFELIGSAGPEVLSVTAILLISPGRV